MAITPPPRRPSVFGSLIGSAIAASTARETQRTQIAATQAAEKRRVEQRDVDRLQGLSDQRTLLSQQALLGHQSNLASGIVSTVDTLDPFTLGLFGTDPIPTTEVPLALPGTTEAELGGRSATATIINPARLEAIRSDPSRLFTKPGDLLDENGNISLEGPQAVFVRNNAQLAPGLLPVLTARLETLEQRLRVVGLDDEADIVAANIIADQSDRISESEASGFDRLIGTQIQEENLRESARNRAENRRQFENRERAAATFMVSTTGVLDASGVTHTKRIGADDAANYLAAQRISSGNLSLTPEQVVAAVPNLDEASRARLLVNFTQFTVGVASEAELQARRLSAQRVTDKNEGFVKLAEEFISGESFMKDNIGRKVTTFIDMAGDANAASPEARRALILLARDAGANNAGVAGTSTDDITITEDFFAQILDNHPSSQSARLAYLFLDGKIPTIQQGALGFLEIQRLSDLGPNEFLLDPKFFEILETFAALQGTLGDYGNGDAETGSKNLRLQATISGNRIQGISLEEAAAEAKTQLPEGVETAEELADLIEETSVSASLILKDPASTAIEKLRATGMTDEEINEQVAFSGATTQSEVAGELGGMLRRFTFSPEEEASGLVTADHRRAKKHTSAVSKMPNDSRGRTIYLDFLEEAIEATTVEEARSAYSQAARALENEASIYLRDHPNAFGQVKQIRKVARSLQKAIDKDGILEKDLGFRLWKQLQQKLAMKIARGALAMNTADLFSVRLPQPFLDIRETIVSAETLAKEARRFRGNPATGGAL